MNATPPLPSSPGNAYQQPGTPMSEPIPSYMLWSILITIATFVVCCISCFSFPGLITGIVAIVFSSQVNSKLNQGDIDGAKRASNSAKIWCWVTTGILILALAVFVVWIFIVGFDGYQEALEEFRQQLEQAQ